MRRPPRPLLLVFALAAATPALATTAGDLCSTPTACLLDGRIAITDGSVLDFGARTVTVTRGSTLDVGPGTMTLRAAALTLEPGAALLGRGTRAVGTGGSITVQVTGALRLQASGSTRSRLDVSAEMLGGTLDLSAGGDVELSGVLAAQATGPGAGGTVQVVTDGAVTMAAGAEVKLSGGSTGSGGKLTVTAGRTVILGGPVDVSGADGGSIAIVADGDLTIGAGAPFHASGTAGFGSGGDLKFDSGGSITLASAIDADASGTAADGAGFAGNIRMTAAGSIRIQAEVSAAGAPPDGVGGDVDLSADVDLEQTGRISVRAPGPDASGGTVELFAGRLLTIGPMDLTADDFLAGSLDAGADIAVVVAGEINADATGDAGSLGVLAPTITVRGALHADGLQGGSGGDTALLACSLTLASTARVSAAGDSGTNRLQAGGHLTAQAGSVIVAGGANQLERLATTPPPVLNGTVTPPFGAPVIVAHPAVPCSAPPGCGDGHVDAGEQCDDGNQLPCDGCSGSCTVERCGNGTTDCGETCDDGNLVDGDGCDHDCTPTACGNGIQTAGEECDDGNRVACDGCSPACRTERCGNGILECNEACDDGAANGTPGDRCDATCRRVVAPTCGDGHPDPGEECDDGNTTPCDGCSADCRIESCGSGTVECAEECDDFNFAGCDGCSPTCRIERCGNGDLECHEKCDDGNLIDGDGCDHDCTPTRCGNGIVTPPEECDDGNQIDDDACDNSCHRRVPCDSGFCPPCTADTQCDPLGRCAGRQCVAGQCIHVTPFACNDADPGTVDTCVLDPTGQPGCQHACVNAAVCDDGDPCNGAEACFQGRCIAGIAPQGYVAAGCALTALDTAVAGAATVAPKLEQKLAKLAATVRGRVAAATAASSAGRRAAEVRALKQARKALHTFQRFVGRAQVKHTLPDPLIDQLLSPIQQTSDVVTAIRDSLKH